MNDAAKAVRTSIVNISGKRLSRLALHSCFISSLLFFFITIDLKKGDISSIVSAPVMAFAYQWRSQPGSICRARGSTKVNITAIDAVDNIPYIIIVRNIALSSDRQRFFSPDDGMPVVVWLRLRIHFLGSRFSTLL